MILGQLDALVVSIQSVVVRAQLPIPHKGHEAIATVLGHGNWSQLDRWRVVVLAVAASEIGVGVLIVVDVVVIVGRVFRAISRERRIEGLRKGNPAVLGAGKARGEGCCQREVCGE